VDIGEHRKSSRVRSDPPLVDGIQSESHPFREVIEDSKVLSPTKGERLADDCGLFWKMWYLFSSHLCGKNYNGLVEIPTDWQIFPKHVFSGQAERNKKDGGGARRKIEGWETQ
jgi:hypothetical protein